MAKDLDVPVLSVTLGRNITITMRCGNYYKHFGHSVGKYMTLRLPKRGLGMILSMLIFLFYPKYLFKRRIHFGLLHINLHTNISQYTC